MINITLQLNLSNGARYRFDLPESFYVSLINLLMQNPGSIVQGVLPLQLGGTCRIDLPYRASLKNTESDPELEVGLYVKGSD